MQLRGRSMWRPGVRAERSTRTPGEGSFTTWSAPLTGSPPCPQCSVGARTLCANPSVLTRVANERSPSPTKRVAPHLVATLRRAPQFTDLSLHGLRFACNSANQPLARILKSSRMGSDNGSCYEGLSDSRTRKTLLDAQSWPDLQASDSGSRLAARCGVRGARSIGARLCDDGDGAANRGGLRR